MHGQRNIKFCNAKQAKQTYQYMKTKTKLYKDIAAIWYNKICRMKQLTANYIEELCFKLVIKQNYTKMHGQRNIKLCNAKQAKQTYQ